MTSIGIKDTYYIFMFELERNESCYRWAVIAFSDHPRWMFRKNLMEFFIKLLNYLYYFTSGYTLLVPWSHVLLECSMITCPSGMFYDHMSFWNVLWSHDTVTWYDYLSSHTIYILTLLYDLILWIKCKRTSRAVLSHYWGSVLLVAHWQYVYAFP